MQDNHDFKAEPNQDRLIESRTHCEAMLDVDDCSADNIILPRSFGSYEHGRDHTFRDFGLVFSRKNFKVFSDGVPELSLERTDIGWKKDYVYC